MAKRKGIFRETCQVCVKLRDDPQFSSAVYNSGYFIYGNEGARKVLERFGTPFHFNLLYRCLKNHKGLRAVSKGKQPVMNIVNDSIIEVLAGKDFRSEADEESEESLDRYIHEGHLLLKEGRMQINAQSFLTAIKIKQDMLSKNKDRRVDVFKAMVGSSGIGQPKGQK